MILLKLGEFGLEYDNRITHQTSESFESVIVTAITKSFHVIDLFFVSWGCKKEESIKRWKPESLEKGDIIMTSKDL